MNTYSHLLQRLLSVNLHGGMKLGLANCQKLNELLGNPIAKFASIHVAGTNGKGSVCTKIAKAYELQGQKVGLFSSPHIATWRERITINGTMISERDVAHYLEKLFAIVDAHNIPATFFELSTLLAFTYFADKKVDVVVIETGLGGRLDSTNIVTPKLSIITSISLDHTEILGNTIEEITLEKAGIIKPNVPVVTGPRVPKEIIEPIAKKNNSPYFVAEGVFDDYLEENNGVARKALEVLGMRSDIIEKALKALPPCRLEILPDRRVVMDVAHNIDGLQRLFTAIKHRYPNTSLRCIVGLSKNKNIKGCLEIINKEASHIHLVEATNGRGAPCTILYDDLLALDRNAKDITIEPSVQKAVENACKQAKEHNELTVICGTFFIMHEARAALGIEEPADQQDLNER